MKQGKRKDSTAVKNSKGKAPRGEAAVAAQTTSYEDAQQYHNDSNAADLSAEEAAAEVMLMLAQNKPVRANTAATISYALGASCTVRDSVALKTDLLKMLDDARKVFIDASAVDRVDTAAMQVLYAFVRDRKARGGDIVWTDCSTEFSQAAQLLGMQAALGLAASNSSGVAA